MCCLFQGTWKKSVVLVENDLDVKLRGRVLSKPKVLKWMIKKDEDVSKKLIAIFINLFILQCFQHHVRPTADMELVNL